MRRNSGLNFSGLRLETELVRLRATTNNLATRLDVLDAGIDQARALLSQLALDQAALRRQEVAAHTMSGIDFVVSPLSGEARQLIDTKIRHVAAQMRMTEAVALRHFGEREVEQLAAITADDWHAAKAVADAAGGITVTVPSTDAAQLVMGLAMAVGQVIREVYRRPSGDCPTSRLQAGSCST